MRQIFLNKKQSFSHLEVPSPPDEGHGAYDHDNDDAHEDDPGRVGPPRNEAEHVGLGRHDPLVVGPRLGVTGADLKKWEYYKKM